MALETCAGGTVPTFLREITDAFLSREAVCDERGRLTYGQLEDRSRLLATELLGLGVTKYARVGLTAPNSADWVIAWFAIGRIGAVAVPISTFSTGPELVRILAHADCQVLLVRRAGARPHPAEQLVEQLPELLSEPAQTGLRHPSLPHLRHVIDLDDSPLPLVCSRSEREAARAGVSAELVQAAGRSVHPDDPATMIYTSGSTSEPKGVVHSHRAVTVQTSQLAEDLSFDSHTRNYTSMPFFWVGGLGMSLLPTLAAGGLHATTETFDPAQILGLIERERLDRVFVYPQRNLDAVLQHPDYEKTDLSSVVRGTPGIPRDHDVTKGISYTRDGLSMGLGMSETFGPYWWGRPTDPPDHYTPPLERSNPGFVVRVVKDDGTPAGEGERGELHVRGPHLALGLQKVERSAVFDEDGFYRTGDMAVIQNGTARYRGRGGDMIKVNGANVASAEVVAALVALPGVSEAFVTAMRCAEHVEIGAAVVPEVGAEIDVDSLRSDLTRSLARYKVPTLLRVLAIDEIPMTPTGKLDQRKLAAVLQADVSAPLASQSTDQEVLT